MGGVPACDPAGWRISQFACFAANCEGNEFPNAITRITPEYAEMISMGKSLWSCASGTCP